MSPFHFGSSDAASSVPASEVKSARIAGARVFMKGGLMNRAVRIFRFPSILMLGSAVCCSTWAEQPSPKQSTSAIPLTNQNNSTSTDQKTAAPATDPSATAASDQQSSTAAEPRAKRDDSTSGREPNESKDKDADAGKAKGKTHFRLGVVTLGAGYAHFPSRFFSPFYPFGLYGYGPFYPSFYDDPLYGSLFYPNFAPNLNQSFGKGQVRLSQPLTDRNAEIYIDGAYAGQVRSLKSMWLDPGAYDLSIESADGSRFQQRIYVLSGKTLKIKPELKSKDREAEK
jgi:hypothetical protein